MKNKILTSLLCILLSLLALFGTVPVNAQNGTGANKAKLIADGIIEYNLLSNGADSVQEWIDGSLSENAGMSSEWYILSLCQSTDSDFTKYESALISYLESHKISASSTKQKYALCLAGIGSTNGYISHVMETTVGEQGIMSYIYGLHLLNNGYKSKHTEKGIIDTVISSRNADGGWSLTGDVSDVDITAMAVQALAPHYADESVKACVNKALDTLSEKQLPDGDFQSYGVSNPESVAQVIVALSALGIDGETDARFIKNGNTLFDGMNKYRLPDGSFCHKAGGSSSAAATSQVLYSAVAYTRMCEGKAPLYILDKCDPENVSPAPIYDNGSSSQENGEQTIPTLASQTIAPKARQPTAKKNTAISFT